MISIVSTVDPYLVDVTRVIDILAWNLHEVCAKDFLIDLFYFHREQMTAPLQDPAARPLCRYVMCVFCGIHTKEKTKGGR